MDWFIYESAIQICKKIFIKNYNEDGITKINSKGKITYVKSVNELLIENNLIPENTPHSIAGGIIYFVSQICNLNVSKKDVKIASNTSEVTINKCYKKLEKFKDKLIPTVIIKKYN